MTLKNIVQKILIEARKPRVRIPIEKGDLGLTLKDPLKKYKSQISRGGKRWSEMSQQLNALVVLNKRRNPSVALAWKRKREALARWVKAKRMKNPNFGR